MRKTLYEVLGVDANASAQEIEAAYNKRIEEYNVSTILDPNKLVVLKQAMDILSDRNQRAAYDASFAAPVGISRIPADEEEPEPTFLKAWGKWIALAVILLGIGIWWARHGSSPPAKKPPPPQVTSESAEPPAEPAQQGVEPTETSTVKQDAGPVAPAQPQDEAPAPRAHAPPNAIAGMWSCFDPISGRAAHYNFRPDGTLSVDWTDGQTLSQKYEVSERVVKLSDSEQTSTLAIEQITANRMVLNTGEGRRLVCTR